MDSISNKKNKIHYIHPPDNPGDDIMNWWITIVLYDRNMFLVPPPQTENDNDSGYVLSWSPVHTAWFENSVQKLSNWLRIWDSNPGM